MWPGYGQCDVCRGLSGTSGRSAERERVVPVCALVSLSSDGLERRYVGWRLSRHREPGGDTVRMGERESRLLGQRKSSPPVQGQDSGREIPKSTVHVNELTPPLAPSPRVLARWTGGWTAQAQ